MISIDWLEQWFQTHCDGEWEHSKGVSITTLDNPGWLVRVDLIGTELGQTRDCVLVVVGEPPNDANGNVGGADWMICEITRGQFKGAGDPRKLGAILGELKTVLVSRTTE